MDFKSFSEIERLSSKVTITEKVHGTNAQILIDEIKPEGYSDGQERKPIYIVRAGSRSRWVVPGDDNFGFATWVEANRDELIKLLGPGRHYGEWYGSGINSGYGMAAGEKRFALFHQGFAGKELPPGVTVVPILYSGPWKSGIVDEVMAKLKAEGSAIAPGFMRPEGVVIRFERNGAMFKEVFQAEETGWSGKPKEKAQNQGPAVDQDKVNTLLQPIRLEKLFSRDERYLREYPKSLPDVVRDYIADLQKEGQLEGVDPAVDKALRKQLFGWVRQQAQAAGYAA